MRARSQNTHGRCETKISGVAITAEPIAGAYLWQAIQLIARRGLQDLVFGLVCAQTNLPNALWPKGVLRVEDEHAAAAAALEADGFTLWLYVLVYAMETCLGLLSAGKAWMWRSWSRR